MLIGRGGNKRLRGRSLAAGGKETWNAVFGQNKRAAIGAPLIGAFCAFLGGGYGNGYIVRCWEFFFLLSLLVTV